MFNVNCKERSTLHWCNWLCLFKIFKRILHFVLHLHCRFHLFTISRALLAPFWISMIHLEQRLAYSCCYSCFFVPQYFYIMNRASLPPYTFFYPPQLHPFTFLSFQIRRQWLMTVSFVFNSSFLYSFSPNVIFFFFFWVLKTRPVHSLMLSSRLFLCLSCLLPPFSVPCKMVFSKPDERETWPHHCSLRLWC